MRYNFSNYFFFIIAPAHDLSPTSSTAVAKNDDYYEDNRSSNTAMSCSCTVTVTSQD